VGLAGTTRTVGQPWPRRSLLVSLAGADHTYTRDLADVTEPYRFVYVGAATAPAAPVTPGDYTPIGEKGERGATGPQGATGPAGADGRDGAGIVVVPPVNLATHPVNAQGWWAPTPSASWEQAPGYAALGMRREQNRVRVRGSLRWKGGSVAAGASALLATSAPTNWAGTSNVQAVGIVAVYRAGTGVLGLGYVDWGMTAQYLPARANGDLLLGLDQLTYVVADDLYL
jgi:hypothetical protein